MIFDGFMSFQMNTKSWKKNHVTGSMKYHSFFWQDLTTEKTHTRIHVTAHTHCLYKLGMAPRQRQQPTYDWWPWKLISRHISYYIANVFGTRCSVHIHMHEIVIERMCGHKHTTAHSTSCGRSLFYHLYAILYDVVPQAANTKHWFFFKQKKKVWEYIILPNLDHRFAK